jgi:hypothetical protein
MVVLADETAKPAPKARLNLDNNGVILKGYDRLGYRVGLGICDDAYDYDDYPDADTLPTNSDSTVATV